MLLRGNGRSRLLRSRTRSSRRCRRRGCLRCDGRRELLGSRSDRYLLCMRGSHRSRRFRWRDRSLGLGVD